ncbi:hypothetical protein LN050_05565 [Comamonadaceae bacterium M7527]|nr:hypothetical protein LN050_05565 [Comamonadaceae bacterium M7527]
MTYAYSTNNALIAMGLRAKRVLQIGLLGLGAAALLGCAQTPAPQWQGTSVQSAMRGVQAYLVGMLPVARLEFERARSALGSTANLKAVANLELLQCAVRAASLERVLCAPSIDPSAMSQAQLVYRDYLNGRLPSDEQRALLPKAQQPVALAIGTGGDVASVVAELVQAAQQPDAQLLSALLACGIAQQHQRVSLAVAMQAVDMASAQGWRKPLLAWLKVQANLADEAGDQLLAQHSRQRIALLISQ